MAAQCGFSGCNCLNRLCDCWNSPGCSNKQHLACFFRFQGEGFTPAEGSPQKLDDEFKGYCHTCAASEGQSAATVAECGDVKAKPPREADTAPAKAIAETTADKTPATKKRRCEQCISPDQTETNCAFRHSYPSLEHSGECERVQDTSGNTKSFGGKLDGADQLLCKVCRDRLAGSGFCLKCMGCCCVTGSDGNADCRMHGPFADLSLTFLAFTAPGGAGSTTTVCDACTKSATAAKKKARDKEAIHNQSWTEDEKQQRLAWNLHPAPELESTRRTAIRFAEFGVMFLTELRRQWENFGSVDHTYKFENRSAEESAQIWEYRMHTLSTAERIGDHHNYCRILFTDPKRRGDSAQARIRRIWTFMHKQITAGKLNAHMRDDRTIDWAKVTGGPQFG